eukprot:NODE_3717_length_860_cov_28.380628_g3694_i0.p1 GENE.NODE_3717_length_860_cov_28.380628_g3694_i0~~NODE_3717_length_860_cov_28.380628_g3694_i0.p1  ORF type:complete len:124 (+),score=21.55 NODE_3717_length_860_cov_28.380628_g3694_i0:408-779(+)
MTEFRSLLVENKWITSQSKWSDVVPLVDLDPRYLALSGSDRHLRLAVFEDYQDELAQQEATEMRDATPEPVAQPPLEPVVQPLLRVDESEEPPAKRQKTEAEPVSRGDMLRKRQELLAKLGRG